jgi:uncharacterized membrane protein YfcA
MRSTLAVYFIVGALFSLVGLGAAGELDTRELWLAIAAAPCLVLGGWLSRLIRVRLRPAVIRRAVLSVCALAAVLLLVRSLFG